MIRKFLLGVGGNPERPSGASENSAILSSIYETNVSVERLSEFKNSFHCQVDEIDAIFSEILHISLMKHMISL